MKLNIYKWLDNNLILTVTIEIVLIEYIQAYL